MSTHYELMHDLIPVIPAMLRLIDHEDPEWSGIKKSHAYIATAIRNLLFNINQEQASQARLAKHHARRLQEQPALLPRCQHPRTNTTQRIEECLSNSEQQNLRVLQCLAILLLSCGFSSH